MPWSSRDAFTVGLPPSWVDDSEEIATNIQRAHVKMSELVKAHAKALMPSFGDGKEDQSQIEVLTREITDLLRKSEMRLKRLSATSGSSEDSNVRKNVQVTSFFISMRRIFCQELALSILTFIMRLMSDERYCTVIFLWGKERYRLLNI